MRSAVACVCLLLAACDPVLLLGDGTTSGGRSPTPQPGLDASILDAALLDPAALGAAGEVATGGSQARDGAMPRALLAVMPSACGRCFDLVASAAGGSPPYQYEWEDGSRSPNRRVCVMGTPSRDVTVIVQDAHAARSAPNVTRLAVEDADAACPPAAAPAQRLCLMNPSFEGTPAVNVGQNFDAVPWSTCSNDPSTTNTPDIGSDAFVVIGNAPKVVDGNSYLALGQGEQVSQALCEDVQGGVALSLQLDVSRVDLAPGDTTKVFLELWGGIAADCSQRQLLWASPALASNWTRYCVALKPVEYMNQLTLRAKTDVNSLAPEYMVVDHLVPVDQCP